MTSEQFYAWLDSEEAYDVAVSIANYLYLSCIYAGAQTEDEIKSWIDKCTENWGADFSEALHAYVPDEVLSTTDLEYINEDMPVMEEDLDGNRYGDIAELVYDVLVMHNLLDDYELSREEVQAMGESYYWNHRGINCENN